MVLDGDGDDLPCYCEKKGEPGYSWFGLGLLDMLNADALASRLLGRARFGAPRSVLVQATNVFGRRL